jgi:hypothetical protein
LALESSTKARGIEIRPFSLRQGTPKSLSFENCVFVMPLWFEGKGKVVSEVPEPRQRPRSLKFQGISIV